MRVRTRWFQPVARMSWLQDAVRPSTCWWIIGASVAAFAAVGIAVFASSEVRPFNRPAQLATFMALLIVGFSWYSARQWNHERQLAYLFERQTQQIRVNALQLSANLVNFLRDRSW